MEIVEVSPRDGLQNESVTIPTDRKIELIRRAAAAGVRRIEAASFVSLRAVPQMADAEAVLSALASLPQRATISVSGLALNRRGVERALAAGCDEINMVVVATDAFNRRNQGVDVATTLAEIAVGAHDVHEAGRKITITIAAAFGCPFDGEVDPHRVAELAAIIAVDEPDEIAIADTIGVADPLAIERLCTMVQAAAPRSRLRLHLHNTRNTGFANAYAGWRAGAEVLDAAIGGIGGCPFAPAATGNIATEDLHYMLSRMGVPTGLDLDGLTAASRWLADLLGRELDAMLPRAGAFPAGDRPDNTIESRQVEDVRRTTAPARCAAEPRNLPSSTVPPKASANPA